MPMEIKCVFQGGGAKLATLLAAAEALEELERSGEIEVTEVAGTSAGSIAAYLFALEAPMRELRANLKLAANEAVEHFSRKPGKWEIIWRTATGRAIFDEEMLRTVIRKTIGATPANRLTLGNATIPVHVRAANLVEGRKHTFNRAHDITADQALLDSCAIPFALRVFKAGSSPYADGGIISNLVEPNVFEQHLGRIVAFSFERSALGGGAGLQAFLGALASTVIDSNVEESIEKIRAVGGHVCVLPNHFGTFDFREALQRGLSDDYVSENKELIKTRVREGLAAIRSRERQQNVLQRVSRLNEFASAVQRAIASRSPYRVTTGSIVCIAGGLTAEPPHTDQLIKNITIEPLGESISAFRVGISIDEAYELGNDMNWEILDAAGRQIPALQEVVETERNGRRLWQSCFYLIEPVSKDRTPLRVRLVTTHVGLMKELRNEGGAEWMRSVSQQDDFIVSEDYIFCAPRVAGTFTMVDLLENVHRATREPSHIPEMRAKWQGGRRLRDDELALYRREHLSLVGYQFIGWRSENVPPRSFSGALVERV